MDRRRRADGRHRPRARTIRGTSPRCAPRPDASGVILLDPPPSGSRAGRRGARAGDRSTGPRVAARAGRVAARRRPGVRGRGRDGPARRPHAGAHARPRGVLRAGGPGAVHRRRGARTWHERHRPARGRPGGVPPLARRDDRAAPTHPLPGPRARRLVGGREAGGVPGPPRGARAAGPGSDGGRSADAGGDRGDRVRGLPARAEGAGVPLGPGAPAEAGARGARRARRPAAGQPIRAGDAGRMPAVRPPRDAAIVALPAMQHRAASGSPFAGPRTPPAARSAPGRDPARRARPSTRPRGWRSPGSCPPATRAAPG